MALYDGSLGRRGTVVLPSVSTIVWPAVVSSIPVITMKVSRFSLIPEVPTVSRIVTSITTPVPTPIPAVKPGLGFVTRHWAIGEPITGGRRICCRYAGWWLTHLHSLRKIWNRLWGRRRRGFCLEGKAEFSALVCGGCNLWFAIRRRHILFYRPFRCGWSASIIISLEGPATGLGPVLRLNHTGRLRVIC